MKNPTGKELQTIVWSNRIDAIYSMTEQAKHEKKDKYCKRINYYGQDEYAIVGESEVIDIDCGLYVAKYTFNNSILTIF